MELAGEEFNWKEEHKEVPMADCELSSNSYGGGGGGDRRLSFN